MGAHEEWLRERKPGIGGSDIDAIAEVSPYAGPLDIYLEKLGFAPQKEEMLAMKLEIRLEPVIIVLDRQSALTFYRRTAFAETLAGKQFRALVRKELKGKNLACWCKLSEECHADVLLQIAASEEEEQ